VSHGAEGVSRSSGPAKVANAASLSERLSRDKQGTVFRGAP
jgi:hypothetical protein